MDIFLKNMMSEIVNILRFFQSSFILYLNDHMLVKKGIKNSNFIFKSVIPLKHCARCALWEQIERYKGRPISRGEARTTRASPTFFRNLLKNHSCTSPKFGGKSTEKSHIVPPQLQISTYGPKREKSSSR